MEPIIMYEAWDYRKEIRRVSVDKFTDKTVWLDGIRTRRLTASGGYFYRWAQAREWLIKRREIEFAGARKHADFARANYYATLAIPEQEPES